ncbi:unnamed protein product [Symbiodinium sp. CCMP2456]|nr:unnamed protein product [Symbiodinium sp. CCMP2456]
MGKRGGWGEQWSHGYWPQHGGATGWNNKQSKGTGKKGKDKGGDYNPENAQTSFPSYETMPAKTKASSAVTQWGNNAASSDLAAGQGNMVRYVQKLANTIRRADGKLRKCDLDRKETDEKWEEYQKGLKQSFLRERKRYYERLEKVQAEKDEFVGQKEEAVVALQRLLANPEEAMRPVVEEAPGDALQEWDTLMQETEQEQWEGIPNILAGALRGNGGPPTSAQKQLFGALGLTIPTTVAPRTPPRRSAQPPAMTPPATSSKQEEAHPLEGGQAAPTYTGPDAATSKDPYMVSPSHGGGATPLPRARSRSQASLPRTSVKGKVNGPVQTGKHASLAEKLDKKRVEASLEDILDSEDEDMTLGELKDKVMHIVKPPFELVDENAGVDVELGHDPNNHRCHFWDIMDFVEAALRLLNERALTAMQAMQNTSRAWLNTIAAIQFLSILLIGMNKCAAGGKTTRGRAPGLAGAARSVCKAFIVYSILPTTAAVYTRTMRHEPQIRPKLSDIQLWSTGQMTMREQLVAAHTRLILEAPLQHGSGEAVLPVYAVTPPGAPLPDHENEETAETTFEEAHVTAWIASPFFESEIVDAYLAFPLSVERLKDTIKEACAIMPHYADEYVPTSPQISDHFASFIALPGWILHTDKVGLVMDCRLVGGTVFAFFTEGPLTLQCVRQHLNDLQVEEIDAFPFGDPNPLLEGFPVAPVVGGVVQITGRGGTPRWSDTLEHRLQHPRRWNPTVEPPGARDGLHSVYQSSEDQVVELIESDDERPLEVAAAEALEINHYDIAVHAPNTRVRGLSLSGRRIWSQIAVLEADQPEPGDTIVAFLDLRGLGYFPQWVQLDVAVNGGEPSLDGPWIKLEHGEVIELFMQKLESSSEGTETSHQANEDGESEDSSYTDPLPHSSDFSDGPSPAGPGPFGPPPPQPVSGDRSRSPRRSSSLHSIECKADADHSPSELKIADHLPVQEHDLTQETILLPDVQDKALSLMRPWSPSWLKADLHSCELKSSTAKRVAELVHWSDVLGANEQIELSIYTDGSWLSSKKLGGYGVVLLLATTTATAIFGLLGEQTQGNDLSPWWFEAPPALKNEQIAIGAALLWIVQVRTFFWPESISIHYDCLAAGLPTQGEWPCTTDFARRLRDLQRWADTMLPAPIKYRHVKAHVGEPYNELADSVAKAAAQGISFAAPPASAIAVLLNADLSWLSLTSSPRLDAAYPWAEGPALRWHRDEHELSNLQPQQLIPTTARAFDQARRDGVDFETVVVTWNVQGLGGQHRYIEEQLQEVKCGIALLQETKQRSSLCSSSRFIRLATDSAKYWGVAVWLSKLEGAIKVGGSPVQVREPDLHVCYESPRLLIISVTIGNTKIIIFSAHCPHSGQREEARSFLQHLRRELQPHSSAALIIGGIDLNGRMTVDVPGVTGDLQYGDQDETGAEAADLCKDLGLWVPTTYSRYHRGQSATFRHPQGTEHRIDYLLQGGAAAVHEASSRVLTDLDSGGVGDDHWPVLAIFRGILQPIKDIVRLWRPRYDTRKMLTKQGKEAITEAMLSYVPPQWSTHPDDHCQHLTEFLHGIMRRHFTKALDGPRASYIPNIVWDKRREKISFKARVRHRASLSKDLLLRAFLQWGKQEDYGFVDLVAKQGLLYQVAAFAIKFVTRDIKTGVRKAKEDFLRCIASDGGGTAADVLSRIKSAGVGGSMARQPFKPLPLLYAEEGQPATSCRDRDSLWLHHFGQQELGTVLKTADFLAEPFHPIYVDEEINWSTEVLPSLGDVEQTLRSLTSRKAPGLDAIPSELLKAAPGPTAAAVHSLFLKSMLTLRQPLQWNGGILFECWKRSGSQSDPAMYRSLYVSSMLGKTYHKLLRNKVQSEVDAGLHSFHLGARRGTPVSMPSLYILAHIRKCAKKGISSSILFLDTHAAYYRIIRQLALGHLHNDTEVLQVFKRFSLEPSDVHELMDEINAGGMLRDAHVDPAIRHTVKDMHRRCWFVSAYSAGDKLCSTAAGSRPGESWADIVYAFVYSRVLHRIGENARGEGLLDVVHTDLSEGPYADEQSGIPQEEGDATWADDSAWPVSGDTPLGLLNKTRRLCSLVLSSCYQHGMQPNLRPNKTSVIFALRGQGKVAARQRIFGHAKATLRLPDLDKEVPVALQYKHLGGIVDCRNTMAAEAKRRLGIAATAFKQGQDLLYLNVTIKLQVRMQLFAATVGATFHNLAQWIPSGQDWDILSGGYTRLLRRLLAKEFPGETALRIPPALVHIISGSWTLELLARRARLSLLGSLARAAPDLLWGALQEEQTWLAVIREDLQWLVDKAADDWPKLHGAAWPEWRTLFVNANDWVKRRTKRRLKEDFESFCVRHKITLTLWAVYKKLEAGWEHTSSKHTDDVLDTELWWHLRFGSKLWKKREVDDYNPSVPMDLTSPLEPGADSGWDEVQKAAHADLCHAILDRHLPADESCVLNIIKETVGKFPLYQDEMDDIVDLVRNEAAEVGAELMEDFWTTEIATIVDKALQSFLNDEWLTDETERPDPHKGMTHAALASQIDSVQWEQIWEATKELHGTPEDCTFKLSSSWETEWRSLSGVVDVSVVNGHLWGWLPKVLREAVHKALQGHRVTLHAPASFWQHQISAPFARFAPLHPN